MGKIKSFLQTNNIKIRSLTNLVGSLAIILAGLFFVLFADVSIKFTGSSAGTSDDFVKISIWLFLAIIFSVVAGLLYFIGDAYKNKKVLSLVLKGIGIVLAIGFIIFLFRFQSWLTNSGRVDISRSTMPYQTIVLVSFVITIISLLFLICNYVFSIIFLDEDY